MGYFCASASIGCLSAFSFEAFTQRRQKAAEAKVMAELNSESLAARSEPSGGSDEVEKQKNQKEMDEEQSLEFWTPKSRCSAVPLDLQSQIANDEDEQNRQLLTTARPTCALTVSSRVKGQVAYYDIFAGPSGASAKLKTTRFSELHKFHAQLMREVPDFQGRPPTKTFMRTTKADFVESRRAQIEKYLRLCATGLVSQSLAFNDFFQITQSSASTTISSEVVSVAAPAVEAKSLIRQIHYLN